MSRFWNTVAFLFILVASTNVPFFRVSAEIDESTTSGLIGVEEGSGTYAEVTDSEYRNITFHSTTPVEFFVSSLPGKIMYHLASLYGASTTHITITGLLPNTIYHRYVDSYRTHFEILTDETGSYSYEESISSPHLIWIQPRKSTKFVFDNATGGDCTSFGVWNAGTKTCTLTSDLHETVELGSHNLTIDGANHQIVGSGSGTGVYGDGVQNVVIKNLTVRNFTDGVLLYRATNPLVTGNVLDQNYGTGISFLDSIGVHATQNTIQSTHNGAVGMAVGQFSENPYGTGAELEDNTIQHVRTGLYLFNQDIGTILRNSVIDAKYIGLDTSRMYNFLVQNNNFSRGMFAPSINDIDSSNTVNGKPIRVVRGVQNAVYDGLVSPIGQFMCIECGNVVLENADLAGLAFGAVFFDGNNNSILHSDFASNTVGVFTSGEGLTLTGNAFSRNETGIRMQGGNGGLIEENSFEHSIGRALFIQQPQVVVRGNTFDSNDLTFDVRDGGMTFYHNTVLSPGRMWGRPVADNGLPDGGNYWAWYSTPASGCIDLNIDQRCDSPFEWNSSALDNFTDRYPWVAPGAWEQSSSTPTHPIIENLMQFKMFGVDTVNEGATFVGNSIVLGATGVATHRAVMEIEFEVKPANTPFDGLDLFVASSTSATSSQSLSVTVSELVPKNQIYLPGGNQQSFHWRARSKDSEGNYSEWREFGIEGNTDFSVKVVPLYTQVQSEFPDVELTRNWATEKLGDGEDVSCSEPTFGYASLGKCGCAITSFVMIARYYGLTTAIDGSAINPRNLNDWLNDNNGYVDHDRIKWSPSAEEYAGTIVNGKKIKRLALDVPNFKTSSRTVVDNYLSQNVPVIVYDNRVGHYLVLGSTLSTPTGNTYAVNDPKWYLTQTLNDISAPPTVRGYGNYFAEATIYTPSNAPILAGSLQFTLASPAEILLTDQSGKKVGKDSTGRIWNDIPGSWYVHEAPVLSSDTEVSPSSLHYVKNLYVPDPVDGAYTLTVIGTGNGPYTLTSHLVGESGIPRKEIFSATTSVGTINTFNIVFASSSTSTIDIRPSNSDLIATFRNVVASSSLKTLTKKTYLASISLIDELIKKGKKKEARLATEALSVLIKLQRGKEVPTLLANRLLQILGDLTLNLK